MCVGSKLIKLSLISFLLISCSKPKNVDDAEKYLVENNCSWGEYTIRSTYCDTASKIINERINIILSKDKVMITLLNEAIRNNVNCGNYGNSRNNPYCRAIEIRLNQIHENKINWWDVYDIYIARQNSITNQKNQQRIDEAASKIINDIESDK